MFRVEDSKRSTSGTCHLTKRAGSRLDAQGQVVLRKRLSPGKAVTLIRWSAAMPHRHEPETRGVSIAVNQELKLSLRRCVALVQECREKLAIVQNRGERNKGSRV